MQGWGPSREVEKVPKTKYERHMKLRAKVIEQSGQLAKLSEGLALLDRHDAPLRGYIVRAKALIDDLAAELMRPK